jgi:superfamily I DNA/RNA helicase
VALASVAESIGWLRSRIESLFADGGGPVKVVTLASVHRAKGSEADRVFVIAHDGRKPLMPLAFADARPWEIEQEYNLCYVAVTRARKELTFAGPCRTSSNLNLGGH